MNDLDLKEILLMLYITFLDLCANELLSFT